MSAFGGKADKFKTSKILPIKIHGACSRLNVFWRCFERRRNADHLRNRQRLRLKLIAYQDKRAKENGSSDQEVRQQRHSHRPFSHRGPSAWYSKYGSGASSDLCCRSHPRQNSRWGCVVETMMSAIGTKQTWASALHMSAFGGKADTANRTDTTRSRQKLRLMMGPIRPGVAG